MFHVSQLRRYIPDPSHIIDHEGVYFDEDMSYQETPVRILDRRETLLRTRTIRKGLV